MGSNQDTGPALQAPAWELSNFINPPSIQGTIVIALTVCLVVSTIAGILRIYAQLTLFKRLAWADGWMIVGWASQVTFAALLYACLPYGAGRHQWDVTIVDYHQIQFFLFIDFVLYDLAILGPKIAILLQLKNIFAPRLRNGFYWATIILIGINIGFYSGLSFALVFQCNPIPKGWNPNIPGQCLNQDALLESSGPFNIISDLLIFILPISAIWQLRLPIKTRLGVASAFACGFFAIRLYYTHRLENSGDATFLIFQNQLWANAEISIALLIANMIILPRFIRRRRGVPSSREYTCRDTFYKHGGTIGQNTSQIPSYEPYIEIADHNSPKQNSQTLLNNQSHLPPVQYPRSFSDDDSSREGIVRTVQINRIVELVGSPVRSPERSYINPGRQ